MKTPEEEADFIYNDMPKTDDPMQWKNWKYRIALAFENYEKEIKEACLKNVENLPVVGDGNFLIDKVYLEEARISIINTKTIKDNENVKTQPCPACGKQLITPKEYFPALTKMNEEISKYREVLLMDIVEDIKQSKEQFYFDNGCGIDGEKDGENAIMVSDIIELIDKCHDSP